MKTYEPEASSFWLVYYLRSNRRRKNYIFNDIQFAHSRQPRRRQGAGPESLGMFCVYGALPRVSRIMHEIMSQTAVSYGHAQ